MLDLEYGIRINLSDSQHCTKGGLLCRCSWNFCFFSKFRMSFKFKRRVNFHPFLKKKHKHVSLLLSFIAEKNMTSAKLSSAWFLISSHIYWSCSSKHQRKDCLYSNAQSLSAPLLQYFYMRATDTLQEYQKRTMIGEDDIFSLNRHRHEKTG